MNRDELSQIEKAFATATNPDIQKRCEALLMRGEGWTLQETAEELGCSRSAICEWSKIFREDGVEKLCSPSKVGRPRALNENQEQLAKSVIAQSQSASRPARGFELQARFNKRGICMSISTLYATLKRLDFSYQTCRPVHPFNDKAVMEAWKAQLPEKIKSVQAVHPDKILKVFFMDEARFGQQGILSRQWSPIGVRPERTRQMEFQNAWIYGAACASTGQSRFFVSTSIGIEFMQIFLNDLAKSLGRGVHALLVMDNAIWHKSPKLKVPKNITIHFQPKYSPELNPMENLWGFMKNNFLCNKYYTSLKEIIRKGCEACNKVSAEIVKSVCFRNYVASCSP